MFELVTGGNFLATLPTTKPLMNHADLLCQCFLIRTSALPRLEHDISGLFFTSRVVSEKGENAWPLRHDRLPFVAFQALVNLA